MPQNWPAVHPPNLSEYCLQQLLCLTFVLCPYLAMWFASWITYVMACCPCCFGYVAHLYRSDPKYLADQGGRSSPLCMPSQGDQNDPEFNCLTYALCLGCCAPCVVSGFGYPAQPAAQPPSMPFAMLYQAMDIFHSKNVARMESRVEALKREPEAQPVAAQPVAQPAAQPAQQAQPAAQPAQQRTAFTGEL